MRETAVPAGSEERTADRPDQAVRKRVAVELIRNHDRQLRWTSRRYSICAEDAEDAYQRGIEILLAKAPTADLKQLLPWTRTVIKHEALAVRKVRERTLGQPGRTPDEPEEDWVQLIPSTSDGPDEIAVQRERVARSREALSLLKPAELKALTQLAEGFSYSEIGQLNDWSRTKVNRCLAEGRARFRSAFRESEAGERCARFEPMISACCDGEADRAEMAELEDHLAACGHCRSTLRAYRAAPRAAAALAPSLPLAQNLWDRVHEFAVGIHMRLTGLGSADSGVQGALASGGTRGAGLAALGKFAAICAGTAGTAAVCAATGVLPTGAVLNHTPERVARERQVEVLPAPPPREVEPEPDREPPTAVPPADPSGDGTDQKPAVESEATPPAPATPAPTPTEAEFTPEASGTPVQAATPPPPKPTPNPVPTSNGGAEFAP